MLPLKHILQVAGFCLILLGFLGCASRETAIVESQYETTNIAVTVFDKETGLTWLRCPVGMVWNGESCDGEPSTFSWRAAQDKTESYCIEDLCNWRVPTIEELYSIMYCPPKITQGKLPLNTTRDSRVCQLRAADSAFESISNASVILAIIVVFPFWALGMGYDYLNIEQYLDPTAFSPIPMNEFTFFWSSTPYAEHPEMAWYANFYVGSTAYQATASSNGYLFLVRD